MTSVYTSEREQAATGARARTVSIRRVVRESPDAVSLVLEPTADEAPHFSYRPGQFLTFRIPSDTHGSVSRCYSLSSSPAHDAELQVTVKRAGYASNWLCDNAIAGMQLDVLLPAGTFVPSGWDAPFLLIAGGSGITPIMSILRTALTQHSNPITLIYANRDRQSVIFAEILDALAREYQGRLTVEHWLESDAGVPSVAGLAAMLDPAPGAHAYLCGPAPFMTAAENALAAAGLTRDRIHKEIFTSLATDAFDAPVVAAEPVDAGEVVVDADTAQATVEIDDEHHTVAWPRDTVLLDVLLEKGIDAPYVCREGNCGGCAYTLREGSVHMRVNDTLDDYDLGKGIRLACQSIPETDHVDVVFDQ